MTYIDTSVLVAYYCPESLSAKAEKAILTSKVPTVSVLTEVELCSAVAKKVRSGDLLHMDGAKILALFRTHMKDRRFGSLALDTEHYRIASDWLGQLRWSLRTLDALHLALAASRQATLLTADIDMAGCGPHLGVKVRFLKVPSSS